MCKQLKFVLATSFCAVLLSACGGSPQETKPSANINDTGVTSCHTAELSGDCPLLEAPGQDADFGRDALELEGKLTKIGAGRAGFDFTKVDVNGSALANQTQEWLEGGTEANGSHWSCVRDNVTKKLWEVKSVNPDAQNYHGHRYSWFSQSVGNGGDSGEENLGECSGISSCDTQAYLNHLNNIKLCGKNNWRLPSVGELLSIADQSLVNPPLDSHFFPNANLNAHWSNQTVASDTSLAWYVYFTAAGNGQIAKNALAHVRMVSDDE